MQGSGPHRPTSGMFAVTAERSVFRAGAWRTSAVRRCCTQGSPSYMLEMSKTNVKLNAQNIKCSRV